MVTLVAGRLKRQWLWITVAATEENSGADSIDVCTALVP